MFGYLEQPINIFCIPIAQEKITIPSKYLTNEFKLIHSFKKSQS
jgi:hypothetical protein